ncbi:GNAT family N-acetyltransferase [Geojedonia litorea]|uniref:GNAT family N-acetyltransferase n=1 Tax=Geojedonia litorea TaxID=1268269 RepID=A0ABV9N328_9FLAO
MEIVVRPLLKTDWAIVSKIYAEGIATGLATFETVVPDWSVWDEKHIKDCRIVAEINKVVVGYAVLSEVSKREVYRGVAEVSVYVSELYRGKNIGETLLQGLITESEALGYWTLQAGIFSENLTSINLHKKCGFRIVGIREKIGKLKGKWYDNHFLERRSKLI